LEVIDSAYQLGRSLPVEAWSHRNIVTENSKTQKVIILSSTVAHRHLSGVMVGNITKMLHLAQKDQGEVRVQRPNF